jgi:hypothetical protein
MRTYVYHILHEIPSCGVPRAKSAKLVPTSADRGVPCGQRDDPRGRILGFLDRSRYFFFQVLICTREVEWTPFQTHYYSENLVAPGIESGTSESVVRNSDHRGGP